MRQHGQRHGDLRRLHRCVDRGEHQRWTRSLHKHLGELPHGAVWNAYGLLHLGGLMRSLNRGGFTFVEILVAMTLMGVITAAIYSVMRNNQKVYGEQMARV